MSTDSKFSPLDAVHRRSGARMVDFGGWEMPLEYDGTISEHMACRRAAAVFDVSHLGTVRLTGPEAFDRIQTTLSNDLSKIAPGRAQYTHLLDDADGSVVDDIIVWWHPGDGTVFDIMPNASNTDRVIAAVGGSDITSTRAVLAVQGPHSRSVLAEVMPSGAVPGRFRVSEFEWGGSPCTAAGTGYTGEEGVEISVPNDSAAEMWDALTSAGVTPAGLGARDTLRLEAGLPLHGQELGPGITPLQADLGWVVGFDKESFLGRSAVIDERERGVDRILRGVVTEGRRPPRSGCPVWVADAPVGVVTSGNFSPVLGHGIALAFVDARLAVGAEVGVEVRGTRLPGRVVTTPFVQPGGSAE